MKKLKKSDFLFFQSEFNRVVRELSELDPSYFEEYKWYQKDIFPNDLRTENELRRDYYKMAFKIEIRKNPKYDFLEYDEIDEIAKIVVDFC
jgi:hypothetical protein